MRYLVIVVLCCACAFAQDSPQEMYERGLNALMGTFVSRSDANGFDLVMSAAKSDYVPAQVTMGLWYDRANSDRDAVYWYKKAAEQGDVLAQWLLGRVLLLSYVGGDHEAAEWLRKAADAGNPFGSYLLALDLVGDDPEQAVPYFRQAAEQGLPFAQYRLGIAYREGKGVEKDKYEAYVWLLLSASQLKPYSGTLLLPQLLGMLESDLGAETVQKAKSEARKRDEKFRHRVLAGGCTWKGALAEFPTAPRIDVQKFCQQEKPIKVYEQEAKAEAEQ